MSEGVIHEDTTEEDSSEQLKRLVISNPLVGELLGLSPQMMIPTRHKDTRNIYAKYMLAYQFNNRVTNLKCHLSLNSLRVEFLAWKNHDFHNNLPFLPLRTQ